MTGDFARPTVLKDSRQLGWALFGLSLAILMSSIDTSIVNIGLPTIARTLHASFASVQWIAISYMLVVTTLIVGIGRLGDLLGKRRLFLIGIAGFTLASLLCALAPSIGILIVARAVQGAGGAIIMALPFALQSDVVPRKQAGWTMGLLTSMVSLGIALGPALGGVLIGACGWPVIFLVNVPLGLLAFYIAWRILPASPAHAAVGQRLDWPGMLILAVALACYDLGVTFSEAQGMTLGIIALLAAALLCVVLFVVIELHVEFPLLNLRMFRNRILSASLCMSVLLFAVLQGVNLVLPFILTQAAGFSMIGAGLVMMAGPAATALFGVPAGKVADRFGTRSAMIAGTTIMAIGCLLWTTLTPAEGAWGFVWRFAITNGSFALFQTPNNMAVMASARPDQRGVVSGLLNLSRNLGMMTGASLMGALFASLVAAASGARQGVTAASGKAMIAGMHGMFLVAAYMVAASILLSIFTVQRSRETNNSLAL